MTTPSCSFISRFPGEAVAARLSSAAVVPATTRQVVMSPPAGFASKLRWWRRHRGFSQLELAGRAEISQRHLSFLELGRSAPSRAMVLRLAVGARCAAAPAERAAAGRGLRAGLARDRARRAGARPGAQRPRLHPAPAGAVPGRRGRSPLEPPPGECRGGAPGRVPGRATRARRSGQSGRRPGRAGRAAPLPGELGRRGALLRPQRRGRCRRRRQRGDRRRCSSGCSPTRAWAPSVKQTSLEPSGPVLPLHFRKGEISLALFTTIATLGTPQDITLQELRIECFFPMDEADRRRLSLLGRGEQRSWSHRGGAPRSFIALQFRARPQPTM